MKPYVRKFISKIEGDRLYWNRRSPLCTLLIAFLNKNAKIHYDKNQMAKAVLSRNDRLSIYIPVRYKDTIGSELLPDTVVLINQMLEDCFEATLIRYVSENTGVTGRYRGYRQAIEKFAEYYNIDLFWDITLDGLVKMESRARKKNQKKIPILVLSVHTPNSGRQKTILPAVNCKPLAPISVLSPAHVSRDF